VQSTVAGVTLTVTCVEVDGAVYVQVKLLKTVADGGVTVPAVAVTVAAVLLA